MDTWKGKTKQNKTWFYFKRFASAKSVCEYQCHSLRMYNHIQCYKSNPLFPGSWASEANPITENRCLSKCEGTSEVSSAGLRHSAGREKEGETNNWDRLISGQPFFWILSLDKFRRLHARGLLGEGLPYQSDSLSVLWQNLCWASYISLWNHSLLVTHLH